MSKTEAMLFTINPEHTDSRLRSVKGVTCELTTHNVYMWPLGLTLMAAHAAVWIVKGVSKCTRSFSSLLQLYWPWQRAWPHQRRPSAVEDLAITVACSNA